MPLSLPRSSARFAVSFALIVVVAGFAVPSCSHDSYLKLTLRSGDTPFNDIATIQVVVRSSAGTQFATLNYDARSAFDAGPISLSQSKTLSIAFTPSVFGDVELTVNAFDSSLPSSLCIGSGIASATIVRGAVSDVPSIALHHTTSCPSPADGGTSVDGNVTFPGCDPGTPGTCPGNQVCFVNCPTRMGECIAGGTNGPGEACTTNNDCVAGTQCFQYLCGVKICLKFCNGNDQCTPTLGGGAGGGGGRRRGRRGRRGRRRDGAPAAGAGAALAAMPGRPAVYPRRSPRAPARIPSCAAPPPPPTRRAASPAIRGATRPKDARPAYCVSCRAIPEGRTVQTATAGRRHA